MTGTAAPAVLRFTLDTNCVLHAVSGHPFGAAVEDLVSQCAQGGAELWLTTAWDQDQEAAGDERRAANLRWISERPVIGWVAQPLLLNFGAPLGRVTLADERTADAARVIQEILLPPDLRGAALNLDDPQQLARWRKRSRDVVQLVSHVFHRHDVFVTSDGDDMIKRRAALLSRAGIVIDTPAEAARRIRDRAAAQTQPAQQEAPGQP